MKTRLKVTHKSFKKARGQKALDVSSPTAQRVQRVFARLRPHAERANKTGVPFNWQMNVIRSDEMNAWAMPGGKNGCVHRHSRKN